MKILMVNKFLHPNGGSETYIFKLGEQLRALGHEVQYFGMEHEGRCVGNHAEQYTQDMDFHGGSKLGKLTYPVKTVYSSEARRKMKNVLSDFKPDIIHINNFNYQLTPSIIYAAQDYRKHADKKLKIIFTAHDYQLVCPNHMMFDVSGNTCEDCIGGHFINCAKKNCIHSSKAKSIVGTAEATLYKALGTYKYIDEIICCSEFLKSKMDTNPVFAEKTFELHNFIDKPRKTQYQKKDYVLYFGRFSEEKGIKTLINVCKLLPEVQFIFAGSGALEDEINKVSNIKNVGFKTGEELEQLISEARFSVYPSEWYENCPFSVMESIIHGTPVVGSDIGGIPELIDSGKTGELFCPKNEQELRDKIIKLWEDKDKNDNYIQNCRNASFDDAEEYCRKLIAIYSEV